MTGPLNEFTQVTKFIPETFGEPGMRTFRLNAESGSSIAKVWLEKEQLAELCMAMNQLTKETPDNDNSFSIISSEFVPDAFLPASVRR